MASAGIRSRIERCSRMRGGETLSSQDSDPVSRQRTLWRGIAAVFAATVLLAACGGDNGAEPASGSGNISDTGSDDAATDEAAQDVPDACVFLDPEEISAAIGRELEEGEPQSTAEGASECRFETALGLDASTSHEDPVVPETALASVTINTHVSDPEEFDLFEESLGAEAEAVTGVGDDAYFWGRDLIYVRVADRGFSIRVTADESDDGALREALLSLAETGASRL